MTHSVDLDPLAEFLASDHAPDGSMDLSELDGFMAGLLAGPEAVEPAEWLSMIWDGEPPDFASPAERQQVMGVISARFEEIATSLDATPPDYAPVFWEDVAGNTIVEDWAAGFMQAVSLRPRAWEAVLRQDDSAALLIPIAAIAGLALPGEQGDLSVPEDVLDRLVADADDILPTCVVGLREYWRDRGAGFPASPGLAPSPVRH
ncbi:MAG: UPF0149 family protein [Acetobacteraceae bacterium]